LALVVGKDCFSCPFTGGVADDVVVEDRSSKVDKPEEKHKEERGKQCELNHRLAPLMSLTSQNH
jgi:hypothetical protein